jgi:hypothetical protein
VSHPNPCMYRRYDRYRGESISGGILQLKELILQIHPLRVYGTIFESRPQSNPCSSSKASVHSLDGHCRRTIPKQIDRIESLPRTKVQSEERKLDCTIQILLGNDQASQRLIISCTMMTINSSWPITVRISCST